MRREKMNNKGFSLVELIIVIAIMAILAAALAPQLMKYIEKSRESTDKSSCTSIESCVNAALANEEIYKEVASKGAPGAGGAAGARVVKIEIQEATTAGSAPSITITPSCTQLASELQDTLKSIKNPKQTGMTKYVATIAVEATTSAGGGASYKLGDIAVKTE